MGYGASQAAEIRRQDPRVAFSYPSQLGVSLAPAAIAADERVGPAAERLAADDAGALDPRMLGPVLGATAFILGRDLVPGSGAATRSCGYGSRAVY